MKTIITLILSIALFPSCNSPSKTSSPKPQLIHKTEKVAPRVENTLQFNSLITDIYEDSRGVFWFASHGDGICRYDPREKSSSGERVFTYYTSEQGLPNHRVHEGEFRTTPMGDLIRSIQEDQRGNLWIHTAEAIVRLDAGDLEKGRVEFKGVVPEPETMLITESFDAGQANAAEAWKEEVEKVWLQYDTNNGVLRLDGDQLTRIVFPTEHLGKGTRIPYSVYSMHKDQRGNIWFGTESGGIFRYNPLRENGPAFECINEKFEKGIVRSIFQDKSGKVWIGNVLVGLHYYDLEADKRGEKPFVNFTKKIGYHSIGERRNNSTLPVDKYLDGIQTIEQDEEGLLWFGSYGDGLWSYDGNELKHFSEGNGIASDYIKNIYKDRRGKLWFGIGNEQSNIYHYDGEQFVRF